MKHGKPRPAHCEPGSLKGAKELGERLRLSRERLAASDLARLGSAWRLWAACADATFGYAREADTIYLTTLARTAGVHRSKAGPLLRRFDELGVFVWKAAPRGSHGISELGLPHVAPQLHEGAHVAPPLRDEPSSCSPQGSPQSTEVIRHELIAHESVEELENSEASQSSKCGTPRVARQEDKPAPRVCECAIHGPDALYDDEGICVLCAVCQICVEDRIDGVCPLCGSEPDLRWSDCQQYGEEMPLGILCSSACFGDGSCQAKEAQRRARDIELRFPPFHGDERTGDGIGDDERSQMRWRATNPTKVRARERRRGQ